MKVILIVVTSVNGKSTHGDDPDIYKWTSKEDQDFFFSLLKQNNLTVMGSKTYEAARDRIKPDRKRLRVILTRHPEKYAEEVVPGQIEFSSESPKELVNRLGLEGHDTMLLVGGGEINAVFLTEGLVNELYLTVEPVIFGSGKPLVGEGEFDVKLKLVDHKVLNDSGTLLLHYKV